MSRSVIMPLSRLSSPQIGRAATLSWDILRAACCRVSFSPMHSAPWDMTSRATAIRCTSSGRAGNILSLVTRPGRRQTRSADRFGLALVPALGELLHELGVERGDVVGLAAGDQPSVGDDLLVDPLGARVAQVGAQAR